MAICVSKSKIFCSSGREFLGFENLTQFFIVDPGDDTLIMWLQSLEDGSIAFPIIEPQVFQEGYDLELLPSELRSLEMENIEDAKVYSILTIPKDVTQISANLKAPIVINGAKNIARQIVLQNNKLSVRHGMYRELKMHIITMANAQKSHGEAKKGATEQPSQPSTCSEHPRP